MTNIGRGLLFLLAPVALASQRPPPVYRGFATGMSYRTFAERARGMSARDALRCKTSANTAQLMECGAMIRDPSDGARFYLSAYVIEGTIAMVSFGDSGDARLLARTRRDLLRRFGPPRSRRTSLEWKAGPRVITFSWRGRGPARLFYINLRDDELLKRTRPYAKRPGQDQRVPRQ
jgi:hypothetical protein